MALVVKVLGFESIWNASISAPDSNGLVTISGDIMKVNPNLEHANTAAMYSADVETEFPPIAEPISITVNPSRIQESTTH